MENQINYGYGRCMQRPMVWTLHATSVPLCFTFKFFKDYGVNLVFFDP